MFDQYSYRRALSWGTLALVMLAEVSAVRGLDLPVATQGTEQWVGVVGQALRHGGNSPEKVMQTFKDFQSRVFANMQEHVSPNHELF